MYTCIHYTYLHTCIIVYLYTCILTHLHTCILVYLNTCILAYLHTHLHAYLRTYFFNFFYFSILISLAINMLEGWDISHLKVRIHSSVWSIKTFLYNIREPRYKQNNMEYKMSRILYNEQSNYNEIWYHQDLCIISLAMNILGGWDTSNFKGDIFRHVSSSNIFLYNIRQPK